MRQPGDVLVFHYSGHGSQVPDRHGDEVDDGLDEIICPYDLDWDDPFTDDDLYDIVQGLAGGREPDGDPGLLPFGHRAARADGRRPWPREADGSTRRRGCAGGRRADLVMRRFGARAAECGAILIAGCRSDQVVGRRLHRRRLSRRADVLLVPRDRGAGLHSELPRRDRRGPGGCSSERVRAGAAARGTCGAAARRDPGAEVRGGGGVTDKG